MSDSTGAGREGAQPRQVRCISNAGCEDSLKVDAIYACTFDRDAFKFGLLSVVDENGELNSYPVQMFEFIEVSNGPASSSSGRTEVR